MPGPCPGPRAGPVPGLPGPCPARARGPGFSTLVRVAKNTNFDDAKLVVPAADLDSWTFQARDEGPDEGTKQQNRSEIGLDGVQRRRKVDPRRRSKTKSTMRIIPRCESFVRGRLVAWQVKTMPLSTSEVGIWLHTERALVLKPRET